MEEVEVPKTLIVVEVVEVVGTTLEVAAVLVLEAAAAGPFSALQWMLRIVIHAMGTTQKPMEK